MRNEWFAPAQVRFGCEAIEPGHMSLSWPFFMSREMPVRVNRVGAALIGVLLAICAHAAEPTVTNGVARLTDAPAIQFEMPEWDYANTSNPVLLTPDLFTNAMLGISRLKPGEPFMNDGPTIPADLNPKTIHALLAKRLRDTPGVKIKTERIGDREVVVATYMAGDQKGMEYAFEMNGYLIRVLLLAKPGHYFEAGARAALKVVSTLKPL